MLRVLCKSGIILSQRFVSSGGRLLSGGYGRYDNWGFRVALSTGNASPKESITLDLGDGVALDMVYIKPGTFTMGGECTEDGSFSVWKYPCTRWSSPKDST